MRLALTFRIAVVALTAAFFILSYPSSVVQAQTAASTVTGTVSDGTGSPVAGAAVLLQGPATYTQTSDAQGKFAIANVTPGLYVCP